MNDAIQKFGDWVFKRTALHAAESDGNLWTCMKSEGAEGILELVVQLRGSTTWREVQYA